MRGASRAWTRCSSHRRRRRSRLSLHPAPVRARLLHRLQLVHENDFIPRRWAVSTYRDMRGMQWRGYERRDAHGMVGREDVEDAGPSTSRVPATVCLRLASQSRHWAHIALDISEHAMLIKIKDAHFANNCSENNSALRSRPRYFIKFHSVSALAATARGDRARDQNATRKQTLSPAVSSIRNGEMYSKRDNFTYSKISNVMRHRVM